MRKSNYFTLSVLPILLGLSFSCDEYDWSNPQLSQSENEVVYGSDDRQDVYAHPDSTLKNLAQKSTVALMSLSAFNTSNPNNYTIRSSSTLGSSYNLCSDQRFYNDPRSAFCSGTLVDDDLIITAGHCVETQSECESTQFVFNYYKTSDNQLQTITSQDVFRCKKLEAHALGQVGNQYLDYAVIRLDRNASPRFSPAPVHTEKQPIAVGAEVAVLGFPTGIPLKIAAGGFVTRNNANDQDYFEATLDTFGGNSGSGVYRMGTYDMVGILVRGATDYIDRGSCTIVNQIAQNSTGGAEDITYVSAAVEDYCNDGSSTRLCGDTPQPQPSCSDNIRNQGEEDVDCGGPCAACPSSPNPSPSPSPSPPQTNTNFVFGLEADGTLYHYDGGQSAGFVYLCLNSNCRTAQLNNGRWETETGVTSGSYNIEFKIQDNATGQCITSATSISPGEGITSSPCTDVVPDGNQPQPQPSPPPPAPVVDAGTPDSAPNPTIDASTNNTPDVGNPGSNTFVFGIETDGTVYHVNGGQTAGFVYICVNSNCQTATLNGNRWERSTGYTSGTFDLEFKIQDNATGQCITTASGISLGSGVETSPCQ